MTKRILVINGNPDPAPERLSAGLASAYAAGALSRNHEVRRLDVGALDFSVMRRAQEFLAEPGEDAILDARRDFLWANHIVFVFPLWLGGPPALLKAFMEQVSRHEFALGAGPHNMPVGKLKGRSGRVIVTMGMPAPVYRLWFGAFGIRAFTRSILGIAGIKPIATTYLGAMSETRCKKWVAHAGAMGARGG